jgi:hypothetical protein
MEMEKGNQRSENRDQRSDIYRRLSIAIEYSETSCGEKEAPEQTFSVRFGEEINDQLSVQDLARFVDHAQRKFISDFSGFTPPESALRDPQSKKGGGQ